MTSQILTQDAKKEKWYTAMFFLASLKWCSLIALAGAAIAVCLFVLSTIFNAVFQLSSNINEVWQASNPVTRLVMLVLAYLVLRKLAPVAVRLYRRGF